MSRVQALLNRIVEYSADPNTIKTCCGVLSILSRSEDKKTEIANGGLLIILQSMNAHMSNEDLLEAACDLLWTLAFNNKPVKASISTHGGITTLLRCVDIHRLNSTLLRSALGTLSNISQLPENQQHIGLGLPVIVAAMQLHARNVELLAFALDTLTSIIIGHEKNCRIVYELGVVEFLLNMLKEHQQSSKSGVVKSACHTLAILCELPGVGKVIAECHGVKIIIQSMTAAPLPSEVERIITVLLFRISKDPSVAPLMIQDGVVMVLFKVLSNQRAGLKCSETLLATCHILCLMTQYASTNLVDLTPFAPSSTCHGELLIRLATDNGAPLALSIFRILAHFSHNSVPMPALINLATMESMLAVAAFHSYPSEMLQLAVEVIISLKRPQFQSQGLKSSEKTLPSLLCCIRTFPDDIKLLDQVFGIVTAYSLSETSSHPRSVFGFIGAAMRFLSRYSTTDWSPSVMIEACRFLLHVMNTKEGLDSMISCGGVGILKLFNEEIAKTNSIPTELEKLLHAMSLRLETPFLMPLITNSTSSLKNQQEETPPDISHDIPSSPFVEDDDDEEDEEDDENRIDYDDDSDENEETNDPQVDDECSNEPIEPIPLSDSEVVMTETTKLTTPIEGNNGVSLDGLIDYLVNAYPHPQDILPNHRNPNTVVDKRYYYISLTSGNKLPKHPLKRLINQVEENTILLTTYPMHNEPATCTFSSACKMQSYIDERIQERIAFFNNESMAIQLVYQSMHPAGDINMKSKIEDIYPYPVPFPASQHSSVHLTFDSEFDSGNLLRAIQIGPSEYDLILRPDLHTHGYTQWFYFAVSNIEINLNYRFNIINLYKPDSLFNTGLQPVIYSLQDAETKSIGWKRIGHEICYYSNPYHQPPSNKNEFFTMSFTISFHNKNDTYLIAHSYPYTIHDHKWHMRQLQFHSPSIVKRSVLCHTIGKIECDLLTITDFNSEIIPFDKRPVIVFTGRVHPGEPQSSWVMRGLLNYLVSDAKDAVLLRHFYLFKIVPILNPDGVFYGNNRCSLDGCDLNRQWKYPCIISQPTIKNIKNLMEKLKIIFYCDIHGHSRKKNVFLYGCHSRKYKNNITKIFPKLLSQHLIGKKYVLYESCHFNVHKNRESTARVVVGCEMGILNSFTLEASFCGTDFGFLSQQHFNLKHYQEIGIALIETLLIYTIPEEIIDRIVLNELFYEKKINIFNYIEMEYNKNKNKIIPLHMTNILTNKTTKKNRIKLQNIKTTNKTTKKNIELNSTTKQTILKKTCILPNPKNQIRYKQIENNITTKYKNKTTGFQRLTTFHPVSFRDIPRETTEEMTNKPRRVSFPTVSK